MLKFSLKHFTIGALIGLWGIVFFYAGVLQTKQNYLHKCIPLENEQLATTYQHPDGVLCLYIHTYGKHYFIRKAT